LTKNEENNLDTAYLNYINNEYKNLFDFTVISSAGCLATLSSQKILPQINLLIIFILMLIYLVFATSEMFNNKSDLNKKLKELKLKYKNNKSEIKNINKYNIWFGNSFRNLKYTGVSLVCIFFMGYTIYEHYLRTNAVNNDYFFKNIMEIFTLFTYIFTKLFT